MINENSKKPVSFFTCCYEADWEFFLKEGRLKKMIERCNYRFANRSLIINNVKNKAQVEQYALSAIEEGVIDNFYFSGEYIDEALNKFSLQRRDFKLDGYDGYWYSLGPLTAVYLCETPYLLYFAGDCMLPETFSLNWIEKGIEILNSNRKVICMTPTWAYNKGELQSDALGEDAFCYYDQGFSDQVFLIKTESFASWIYQEYNAKSEVFPIYGGNHFERKIFCFINNRQLLRGVFKTIFYTHEKLIIPGYVSKNNKNYLHQIKYIIAKIKRKLRKRNILLKYLLR